MGICCDTESTQTSNPHAEAASQSPSIDEETLTRLTPRLILVPGEGPPQVPLLAEDILPLEEPEPVKPNISFNSCKNYRQVEDIQKDYQFGKELAC